MDWEQDDDEDNSWSIRDLDHAPEPPPSIHSITGVIDGSLSSSAVSAVATAHVSPRPPHHHPYHHHFGNSNKTLLSSIVAAAKHRLAPSLQQQQVDSHSLSTAQQQNYPHNPITTTTTSSAAAAMTSTNTSSGTINASSLTGVAGPTVTSTPPRPMPNRPNVLGLRDRVWSAPHSATNNNKNYYYNVNNNKSKNNNHSSSSSFIHSYSHPHYYYQPTTAEPFLSRQQRQEQEHKQQRARSASLPDSPTNMAKKQPQPSSPRTNNETLFSVAATTTTAAAPAALVEATTATDIRQPGMRSAGSSTSSSSRNHTYRNRQGGRIRLRRQRRTNSLSNTSSNYSSSSCPVPSVSFLPQLPTLFIPNLPQEDHEQQEVAATNDEKQAPPLPSTKLSFRAEKGEDNNNNNKDDHGDGVDEDVVDETENTTETGGGTMTESEIHGHSSEKKEDGNDTKTTSDMRERVDETGNNHHCREAQEVGNDPMIYSLESFNSLPDDNISTPSEDKQDDDDCNNDYIERRHEPELLDMDDDDINNKEHEEDDMGTILPWTKQTKSSKRTPLDDSSFDDHDEETNKDEGGGDVLEDLDESDHSVNPDSSTRLNSGKRRLRRPTMHQIASFVVMHAPCFWIGYGVAFLLSLCRRSSSGSAAAAAARLRRQPTDRAIVSRLNILVGLFALFQIGSALFFAIVTLTPNTRLIVVPTNSTSSNTTTTTTRLDDDNGNGDPRTANDDLSYYNNNNETMDGNETFDVAVGVGVGEDEQQSRSMLGGGRNVNIWNIGVNVILLGVEAFVLVLAALLTVRVVRNVNLVGAIRYLWVLLWILPFQIFFNIGLYDYFKVTDVWVRHYWRDETMGWFREKFCEPQSTANTLCTVPLGVNETDWCLALYNSTRCASIRNSAQQDTEAYLLTFYYANASWGLALICLLFLLVNTLERIISKPLVRKSRQSNVPAWLSLPILSCVIFGLVYTYAETSGLSARSKTEANWIGPLYMVTAGLFFLAALLGWYISVSSITNTRHKRNKMIYITCFILLMILIAGSLIALFAASVTFSSSFVKFPLTQSQRGDLACYLDQASSCSNCNDLPKGDPNRCTEWTVSDVTKVIQTQAKNSAALAAILMLYAFSALRFGWAMRKHIRMYQIEYV